MLAVAILGYDDRDVPREQLADHTLGVPTDSILRIRNVLSSLYQGLLLAIARSD